MARLVAHPPAAPALLATVSEFDDAAGLGVLQVAGAGDVAFHCTAIADGSRSIAVGSAVVCRLVAGHHGRVEATGVVHTDAPSR